MTMQLFHYTKSHAVTKGTDMTFLMNWTRDFPAFPCDGKEIKNQHFKKGIVTLIINKKGYL